MCAVPGWSVGLVESLPIMPQQGRGETLGGRRQLEIGSGCNNATGARLQRLTPVALCIPAREPGKPSREPKARAGKDTQASQVTEPVTTIPLKRALVYEATIRSG